MSSEEFARAKREDQIRKQAGINRADGFREPHFAEGVQQKFPASRLNNVAENVESHSREHPAIVDVLQIADRLHDVKIVENPNQAGDGETVAKNLRNLRRFLRWRLEHGVQGEYFGVRAAGSLKFFRTQIFRMMAPNSPRLARPKSATAYDNRFPQAIRDFAWCSRAARAGDLLKGWYHRRPRIDGKSESGANCHG